MSEAKQEQWFLTSEDDYPTGQVSTTPLGNGDVCVTYGDKAKERARLIASAPGMLKDLRRIAVLYRQLCEPDWHFESLREFQRELKDLLAQYQEPLDTTGAHP